MTILASLTASQATALEVFSNSGTGVNIGPGARQIGGPTPISTGAAQGFTFGTGNAFTQIESITLGLNVTPGSPNISQLVFALYSNSSSLPGTEITRFSSTPVGGFLSGQQLYTFNYQSGTLNLSPNTSYWIVATYVNQVYTPALNTPTMNWLDSNPAADPTAKAGYNITYLGAATRATGFGAWSSSGDDRALRVSLNLVPEPSTYALGLVGTLVMGAVARRKGRKTASA